MAQLFADGKFQGFDDSGNPLNAGKLYTYAAGTTTPLATYTTQAGDVANAVDITLDAAGRASVWLGASSYRMILKNSSGTTIWDVDNITPGQSDAVTFTPAGTGAVATTVQTKLRQYVTVSDFIPAAFNTTNDATTYVQAALNSGATVVDFLGIALKCDSVTVPAGVWAKNVHLTKYTGAAGNVVLVNTGCTVTGYVAGTGLTSAAQRCIYPAADGVTDVCLNVEVTAATYGVHAQYLTTDTDPHRPKRWNGYIYAHDIVGTVGDSEGYGVLLSPADSCQLVVKAVDIRRHAVYLSAGASDNVVDLDCDGCGNYASQIAALSPQAACQRNRLTLRTRNLTTDVAGQSGALALTGRSHYNVIHVQCEGNSTTYEAIRIEGGSGGVQADHPLGNQIINGTIVGQFTGADVIRMLNADGTIVRGNVINAYGTSSVIATRRSGTNLSTHGGYISDNTINAQGQAIKGIYDEVNTVPSYIGPNDISNNSTALRVDDQTGGYRTGYSRRLTFSGTTASIPATSVADTTVTFALSRDIQTAGRRAGVHITGSSVNFLTPHAIVRITPAPSSTTIGFRLYNASGDAQTFDYSGWVEGD